MRFFIFILVLFTTQLSSAQIIPIHDYWNREIERHQLKNAKGFSTSYKPLLQSHTDFKKFDSQRVDSAIYYWNINRILFRDHWLTYQKENVHIMADPWVDFSYFKDPLNRDYNHKVSRQYNNSRGIWIQGNIGNSFSFHTAFSENQSIFPFYMSAISDSLEVIPGWGRFKAFKKYGYDYAVSNSSIQIEPHSKLQISLSYGKQFIGSGYRSILLSDAAMSYPFASIRYSGKWFTYLSSAALLQEQERLPLGSTSESLFKRKMGTWNFLIVTPLPTIEVGFLESVLYEIWTPQGRKSPHYSSYIPVIGARSFLSDQNTASTLYGLNLKWNAFHQFTLYGQYGWLNNKTKSYGIQSGILYSNFLIKNLDIRIEYNSTSAFMYSSAQDLLSYTQQQQALGHPAGGDMQEWSVRVDYTRKRFLFHGDIHQINQTLSHGADPYQQSFFIGSSGSRSMLQWQLKAGCLINPKVHLCFWLGYTQRNDIRKMSAISEESKFNASLFTINLSSTLNSQYFDF